MKKTKKLLCLLLCAVMLLTMTGCPGPGVLIEERKSPERFPGSTWSTENGEISFYITEEPVERFSGYYELEDGTLVYRTGLTTNIFGEICINGEKHKFFVYDWGFDYDAFYWIFLAEDMPTTGHEDILHDQFLKEYTLMYLKMRYKKNRCFGEVAEPSPVKNKFYEVGTEFEFFRTDK